MISELFTQRFAYLLQPVPVYKQDSGGGGGGGGAGSHFANPDTTDTSENDVRLHTHLDPVVKDLRDGIIHALHKVLLEGPPNAPTAVKDEAGSAMYLTLVLLLENKIAIGVRDKYAGVGGQGLDEKHRGSILPVHFTRTKWQRSPNYPFQYSDESLLKETQAFLEALRRLSDVANEGNAGGTLSRMLADAQTEKEVAHAKDHGTAAGSVKDLIALDIDALFNVERGDAVNISDVQESLVKPGGDAEANIAVGPPPPDPYGVLSVFEDNEESKVALPTDLGLYWESTPPPPPAQNVISRDNEEVMVTLPTDLDCYWRL